jgi:hypothetical protein
MEWSIILWRANKNPEIFQINAYARENSVLYRFVPKNWETVAGLKLHEMRFPFKFIDADNEIFS